MDLSYVNGFVKRDSDGNLSLPTEELTAFYHQEFVKALKSFGYMKNSPSLLDLNVEILQNGALKVLHGICLSPFQFVDWSKMSPEDMMEATASEAKTSRKLYLNIQLAER